MSELDGLRYEIAQLKKQMGAMIRSGTLTSFDAAKNTAKLDLGIDGGTHDIPNGANHAHSGGQHWSPPSPGMQVTVFAPDGDLTNAFFMPGGYRDNVPKPSTRNDEDVIAREGGSAVHVRKGGFVRLAAGTREKLKIKLGDQFFIIRAEALEASTEES